MIETIMNKPATRANNLYIRLESHFEEQSFDQQQFTNAGSVSLFFPQRPSAPSAVNNSWVAGEARAAPFCSLLLIR